MPKSKVSAFLSVLLVFASGAAMGAVGYRLYTVKAVNSSGQPPSKKKLSPEELQHALEANRKLLVSHLKAAVKLDDQQLTEIQKIMDWQGDQFMEIRKKYQAQTDQINQEAEHERDHLHEVSVAKIKALLTNEQQPLYDKWLADRAAARAAERKRHQEQQQQQGPGPHKDGRRPPLP
jgi:hypothetical protein